MREFLDKILLEKLKVKDYKSKDFQEDITMLDRSNACKKLAAFVHMSSQAKMLVEHDCEETGHYPKAIPQANGTWWASR